MADTTVFKAIVNSNADNLTTDKKILLQFCGFPADNRLKKTVIKGFKLYQYAYTSWGHCFHFVYVAARQLFFPGH